MRNAIFTTTTIIDVLRHERPTLTLKQYAMAPDWDRGTYDEWNTTVLAFASLLPVDEREAFVAYCKS